MGRQIAVIEAFTSAQLDLALGRSNVIHAALLAGPESETFLARTARLDRFRTGYGVRRQDKPQIGRSGDGMTIRKRRELRPEWPKRRKRLAKKS